MIYNELKGLKKGDLIVVRWMDASEVRAGSGQHDNPEVYVKDLGVYLGVTGTKRKHIIVGKDVIENWNDWGAVRIPLDLVESVVVVVTMENMLPVLREIQALTRKVRLRKYRRFEVD